MGAVPERYFAYGSNLKLARMRERVPSARVVAPGRLEGFRLTLDKPGRDGSGKANLVREAGARAWGVVYAFEASAWPALDDCEPGYERIAVPVAAAGSRIEAQTYVALRRVPGAPALEGYLRLIREGAREHGLPAEWLAELERIAGRH